jgi:hypothetical protein
MSRQTNACKAELAVVSKPVNGESFFQLEKLFGGACFASFAMAREKMAGFSVPEAQFWSQSGQE